MYVFTPTLQSNSCLFSISWSLACLEEMKQSLLNKISELGKELPLNTLDELIDKFGGPEKVSEVIHYTLKLIISRLSKTILQLFNKITDHRYFAQCSDPNYFSQLFSQLILITLK